MARRRQHRQTESQARNDFEIPDLQQINAHCSPKSRPTFTAIRQAIRRLGINHDCIEASADASSLLNNCAPEFSIGGCISSVLLFHDGTLPAVHKCGTVGTFRTSRFDTAGFSKRVNDRRILANLRLGSRVMRRHIAPCWIKRRRRSHVVGRRSRRWEA
jgi:hypothetical protein